MEFEPDFLRALALENANAKSKDNLAFYASKCFASENGKPNCCKFFARLLQYNSKVRIVL